MSRLTKAMIDHMVAKSLDLAGVTSADAALEEKRLAWGREVRIFLCGGAEVVAQARKIEKRIRQLQKLIPKGLNSFSGGLHNEYHIRVNLAGVNVLLPKERFIVPHSDRFLKADNPLVQQFYDLEAEGETIEAKRAEVSSHVRGTLQQFTTVKKLLEAWPEAKELLPPAEANEARQLPVVQVADLNALVGLPSGEQP